MDRLRTPRNEPLADPSLAALERALQENKESRKRADETGQRGKESTKRPKKSTKRPMGSTKRPKESTKRPMKSTKRPKKSTKRTEKEMEKSKKSALKIFTPKDSENSPEEPRERNEETRSASASEPQEPTTTQVMTASHGLRRLTVCLIRAGLLFVFDQPFTTQSIWKEIKLKRNSKDFFH